MLDAALDALEAFHFLRPEWLLAFPAIALAWWVLRRREGDASTEQVGIAPHLSEAMRIGAEATFRWQPIDATALMLFCLFAAASGPTWSRVPNPFLSQTAPMVVVLEVTRSMEAPDVQPSRLDRAKFKVMDLIERRAGARTAIIAYAGSAHRLAPLTEDPEVLRVMLEALSPAVMPRSGSDVATAMDLARSELAQSSTPGTIVLVTDGVDSAEVPFLQAGDEQPPVIALFVAPEGESSEALGDADIDGFVRLSADDSDLDTILRIAGSAYRAALLGDERLEWEDRGWLFAWPAALLLALWFRQGWTVRWTLVGITIFLGLTDTRPARADPIDWFLTPDQQGMLAYDKGEFDDATSLFHDPIWRARSLMRQGAFQEAADILSRIDTAEAAFAEGFCHLQSRRFRNAAAAYERTLILQPDFPDAARNLLIAQAIVEFAERGKDLDKEGGKAGEGKPSDDPGEDKENAQAMVPSASRDQQNFETAEQWMRAVDTNMADFLKVRFNIELREATK